jgi:hypothetical protein
MEGVGAHFVLRLELGHPAASEPAPSDRGPHSRRDPRSGRPRKQRSTEAQPLRGRVGERSRARPSAGNEPAAFRSDRNASPLVQPADPQGLLWTFVRQGRPRRSASGEPLSERQAALPPALWKRLLWCARLSEQSTHLGRSATDNPACCSQCLTWVAISSAWPAEHWPPWL